VYEFSVLKVLGSNPTMTSEVFFIFLVVTPNESRQHFEYLLLIILLYKLISTGYFLAIFRGFLLHVLYFNMQ
jgi:hypothetical protein